MKFHPASFHIKKQNPFLKTYRMNHYKSLLRLYHEFSSSSANRFLVIFLLSESNGFFVHVWELICSQTRPLVFFLLVSEAQMGQMVPWKYQQDSKRLFTLQWNKNLNRQSSMLWDIFMFPLSNFHFLLKAAASRYIQIKVNSKLTLFSISRQTLPDFPFFEISSNNSFTCESVKRSNLKYSFSYITKTTQILCKQQIEFLNSWNSSKSFF